MQGSRRKEVNRLLEAPGTGVGSVKSIGKAMMVLEAFLEQERYLSLNQIIALTGLDKSAVQRATRTLVVLGYLTQDEATRRYSLGARVLDLSYFFLRNQPLVERALPILVDLRAALGERVDLTLPDGVTIVYLLRMQAKREAFRPALVGRRMPMYCTAPGRAILSNLPDAEVADILDRSELRKYTPDTLIDRKAIEAKVAEAAQAGFAVQTDEWLPTELSAAAPVRDMQGRPIAAVSVTGSTNEWSQEAFLRHTVAELSAAASDLSAG